MLPRTLIATAAIPGGGELRLMQRGGDFQIMLGGNELMSSRLSGSEAAMATLAAERLQASAPAVLIGGLGMGFTLRAALEAFGPAAAITVAELVPAVVDWARGPMAALFAGSLDDGRVTVRVGDVADMLAPAAWDAILLDVDNGPDGLTQPANDRLYREAGLRAAWRSLRPGGVLAIWSADASPAFTRRLREVGYAVEEMPVRSHRGTRGRRHMIWLATRPASGPTATARA